MHHLIAVLDSMCIHLCCVTLVRDRMVWNIIWWNQLWVPIATPLVYENHSEFGAEHALVGAHVSWGCFWVFLGPRFIILLSEVQQAWVCQGPALPAAALPGWCSCVVPASAGEGPSDLAEKRVWLVPLKSEYGKGWKTSEMQKRAVLKKICIMNGDPCAREKEYAVIKI